MEATKIYPEVIVPEKSVLGGVTEIIIQPKNKTAVVEIETEDGNIITFNGNLTDEWATVSESNKTIIRTFLKRIVAVCMDTPDENITGDAL